MNDLTEVERALCLMCGVPPESVLKVEWKWAEVIFKLKGVIEVVNIEGKLEL